MSLRKWATISYRLDRNTERTCRLLYLNSQAMGGDIKQAKAKSDAWRRIFSARLAPCRGERLHGQARKPLRRTPLQHRKPHSSPRRSMSGGVNLGPWREQMMETSKKHPGLDGIAVRQHLGWLQRPRHGNADQSNTSLKLERSRRRRSTECQAEATSSK